MEREIDIIDVVDAPSLLIPYREDCAYAWVSETTPPLIDYRGFVVTASTGEQIVLDSDTLKIIQRYRPWRDAAILVLFLGVFGLFAMIYFFMKGRYRHKRQLNVESIVQKKDGEEVTQELSSDKE